MRLLQSWWQGDRPRVSRSEMHLLQLRPPCVTLLDGEPVEVLRRTVTGSPPCVLYDCRTSRGRACVVVTPGGLGQAASHRWIEPGERGA
ncbi:MAG: hypothetical protein ACREJB_19145 [Planctomycetaceae bacterium]